MYVYITIKLVYSLYIINIYLVFTIINLGKLIISYYNYEYA